MFSHSTFMGLAGVARADITPPVGIYCRNWGAAAHDTADGIHRPLSLTALAIQAAHGGQPLVLIDVDLGWWISLVHERAFRQSILDELGLPAERFLFCLSHTHSAPPLAEPEPHWPGGDLLAAHLHNVRNTAAATAGQAIAALKPAIVDWHHGRCALAANRDLNDPTRTSPARVVCGFNPDEPADDFLLVGRVTSASGRPLATLVNYACHPTTLAWTNRRISPDFVGAMRETIERETEAAPAMFLQGASGELAPRFQYVDDTAVADAHGRELAFAALATLAAMEPPNTQLAFDRVVESGAPLAAWRREPKASTPLSTTLAARTRTVDLALKNWPTAAELHAEFETCRDRALAERLRRKLRIRQALGDGGTFAFTVWGWRIGETLLLGTMAECYSSIQQKARSSFPDNEVVWLNLVNGSIGYLPPAPLYDVDIYQVWQTPFDCGGLERTADAAIGLGQELFAS